jgi:hypothetical protein
MVNEDRGVLVAGLGKCPCCLAKEAWFRQLVVVNGDALPWLGGSEDSVLILALFTPPRNHGHGTNQAAGTSGSAYIGQSLGDLTMEGKFLEHIERMVAKTIVPTHELSLVIRSLVEYSFASLMGEEGLKVRAAHCRVLGCSSGGGGKLFAGTVSLTALTGLSICP